MSRQTGTHAARHPTHGQERFRTQFSSIHLKWKISTWRASRDNSRQDQYAHGLTLGVLNGNSEDEGNMNDVALSQDCGGPRVTGAPPHRKAKNDSDSVIEHPALLFSSQLSTSRENTKIPHITPPKSKEEGVERKSRKGHPNIIATLSPPLPPP